MGVAQMNVVIKIAGSERGAGHDKGAERGPGNVVREPWMRGFLALPWTPWGSSTGRDKTGSAGHQPTGNSSSVVLSCLSMRSIFKVFGVLFLLAKRRACPMEGNDLGLH
jgi:hypothetical protein